MPTNKRNSQQLPFDFESARVEANAWLISAMEITEATEKERAVVGLVYRITSENGGVLNWTLARIGEEFRRDRQTVRRWINAAIDKGLLLAVEQKNVRGGQRCHLLSIDWESVRRIACRRGHPEDAKARNRDIKPCAKPEYQNPSAPYQNTPALGDFDTPIRNNCAFTAQLKPPPTPSDCASLAAVSWEGVGEELRLMKMATRRELVEQLKPLMTAADAMALIDVWKAAGGGTAAAAWKQGALCRRLLNWEPGQSPQDLELWPDASDAYQREQERRRRQNEHARGVAAMLLRRAEDKALRDQIARARKPPETKACNPQAYSLKSQD